MADRRRGEWADHLRFAWPASTMTSEEMSEILRPAVSLAGKRVPVLATVAETMTAGAVHFAQAVVRVGADGLTVLPGAPYVSDRREVVAHIRTQAGVAGQVDR